MKIIKASVGQGFGGPLGAEFSVYIEDDEGRIVTVELIFGIARMGSLVFNTSALKVSIDYPGSLKQIFCRTAPTLVDARWVADAFNSRQSSGSFASFARYHGGKAVPRDVAALVFDVVSRVAPVIEARDYSHWTQDGSTTEIYAAIATIAWPR